jgi:molybdenum cofactor cytidylyltransferase
MKRSGVAGVLLAAGASRRLGHAKQLLRRDGETLVHRAARLMLEVGVSPLLLVVGSAAAEIIEACRDLSVEPLLNTGWEAGLGSSLELAATRLADDERTLIAVCDQPGLELQHLERLVEGALAGAYGCAATQHGTRLGVPAVVPGAWLKEAGKLGDRGLGSRLSALPAGRVLVLAAPILHLDLDTESNVAHARATGLLDLG